MNGILRTLVLVAALLCGGYSSHAQEFIRSSDSASARKKADDPVARYKEKVKKPKAIKHEFSGGIRLNTDGWSVYTDFGKIKTNDPRHVDMYHNVRLLQIEFTEKKNYAEYKSTSPNGTGNNTYIYGKINNFYALKFGWGFRRMLAGKPDPGSVSIHWVNVGGLSIGLLKPYYLNVWSDPAAIEYKDPVKGDFLNQYLIEGAAGFSKGLDQISVIPGAHFKSAIHFDFSSNRKTVIGVETGFDVEYYTSPVPLIANQTAVPYFFDLFIAAQFGKRW